MTARPRWLRAQVAERSTIARLDQIAGRVVADAYDRGYDDGYNRGVSGERQTASKQVDRSQRRAPAQPRTPRKPRRLHLVLSDT